MSLLKFTRSWLGKTTQPEHLVRGEAGENAAKKHLKRSGLKFLTANFRSARGEIDLIFRDQDCLVFVEVKSRSSETWTRPAAAVNVRKRRLLSQTALDYLRLLKQPQVRVRFDIVEVLLQEGAVREVRHLPNSFALSRACTATADWCCAMPELPEVEVLVRHLAQLLKGKIIRDVTVRRAKILQPTDKRDFKQTLTGATFLEVHRRAKYLLFNLRSPHNRERILLVGHLGMTGRMYLQPSARPIAKHAAVIFALGRFSFVYEDTRYFGRLTLDAGALARLGPEPFAAEFNEDYFSRALRKSVQPIKVKLLDQSLVAGLGNIYASEVLFLAGISPRIAARNLKPNQIHRLWQAIRAVLDEAIRFGSTVPLDWAGAGARNRLFYYGRADQAAGAYEERLRVYDRAGQACVQCGREIKRIVQSARSTFYCPSCQRATSRRQLA